MQKSALQYGEIIFQSKVMFQAPFILYMVYCIPYMEVNVDFLPYMEVNVGKKKKRRNEVDTKTVKIATSGGKKTVETRLKAS